MGRWSKLGLVAIGAFVVFVVWPFAYFRNVYDHGKRLRVVVPGKFYRSGQLTAEGFADAVRQLKIRTIVNVQDDFPDPDVVLSFWTFQTIRESTLCKQLGVRYVALAPDLIARDRVGKDQPEVIDQMLTLLDQEDCYPVLLHCKAGLHRTGCLCAVYRMEYDGWSNAAAFRELRAHGFGDTVCTAANDYVNQYVLTYRPRHRRDAQTALGARPPASVLSLRP